MKRHTGECLTVSDQSGGREGNSAIISNNINDQPEGVIVSLAPNSNAFPRLIFAPWISCVCSHWFAGIWTS